MKFLELSSIESFFREKITEKNSCFVFPNDVAAQFWSEWCILDNNTSVKAVSCDRFLAWDTFKSKFASGQLENYNPVPPILRKFFVENLIQENADRKPDEKIFKKIINPRFAASATNFSNWICGNLTSLHLWKKKIDQNSDSYGKLDLEDEDYLELYTRYKEFLEKNQLFEQSWIENIEFKESGLNFYLFYPEQLEDFADFRKAFESTQNVTALTFPRNIPSPSVYNYPDARKELRQTVLRIIDIVNSGKADWSEITLTVPDLENVRPYIERELSLYEVPFKIRAGISLVQNCAGQIFTEIKNCHDEEFSFDSVRALLLDENVPWKDELSKIREDLVREGNRMRCICSYERREEDSYKKIDVWLSAFNSKIRRTEYLIGSLKSKPESDEKTSEILNNLEADLKRTRCLIEFYHKLRNHLEKFFSEKNNSFANVREAWFSFKGEFLKSDEFSKDADLILSRCVSELDEIISIERKFAKCNLTVKNPFNFFMRELKGKSYTPQQKKNGVSVFPYKLSASAGFKYQFVIGASQSNLDVPYKRLSFLNSEKRGKLGLTEEDKNLNASEVFIKLYGKKVEGADEIVHFSSSSDSFSGFAIPHSLLSVEKSVPDYDSSDYILQEKAAIQKLTDDFNDDIQPKTENLKKITETQKKQFENWKKTHLRKDNHSDGDQVCFEPLRSKKMNVSARGSLEPFFPCPRKWLFKTVLHLGEDSLDTELMGPFDMGNLNHKILEEFMKLFIGKKLPFYDTKSETFMISSSVKNELNSAPVPYENEIHAVLFGDQDSKGLVEKAITNSKMDFADSPLVVQILKLQKNKITSNIMTFLKTLLLPFGVNPKIGEEPKEIYGIGLCTVSSVEKNYSAERDGFCYYGTSDCVLKSPENQWIVIDYKNTKTSLPAAAAITPDENRIMKQFQMPLYFNLVMEGNKNEVCAGYFYAIKGGAKSRAFDLLAPVKIDGGFSENSFDNYSAVMKTLDEYAELFVDKVHKLEFTPHYSSDKKDRLSVNRIRDCGNCNFKAICRTTYNVAEKKIETR